MVPWRVPPHFGLRDRLDSVGARLAPLGLRVLLAWGLFESGRGKLRGENGFGPVMANFRFRFDRMPADLSGAMATWFELLGGVALPLGLATRFVATSLFALTVIAIAAVYWPQDWMGVSRSVRGYAITDRGAGHCKLPMPVLAMLWPLAMTGPGRMSLDDPISRALAAPAAIPRNDTCPAGA